MNIPLNVREQCSACPIRHRAVCARCDDEELALLEMIKSYRTFAAGEEEQVLDVYRQAIAALNARLEEHGYEALTDNDLAD